MLKRLREEAVHIKISSQESREWKPRPLLFSFIFFGGLVAGIGFVIGYVLHVPPLFS